MKVCYLDTMKLSRPSCTLLELWSILVVVLWSSNGPGFLGGWVDLLSIVSGLLLELLETLAHLGEHVELHEVLGVRAVGWDDIVSKTNGWWDTTTPPIWGLSLRSYGVLTLPYGDYPCGHTGY